MIDATPSLEAIAAALSSKDYMSPSERAELAAAICSHAQKQSEDTSLWFRRGYYCAVANLIRLHGDGVAAEDTLRNYGGVDFAGIDEGDVEVLRKSANEIKRRAALRSESKEVKP